MTTTKFRKKPVEIEAMRFQDNGRDVVEWVTSHGQDAQLNRGEVLIVTLEGIMHASPGDWIICGVQGEFYPCKPDIFDATYERADAAPERRIVISSAEISECVLTLTKAGIEGEDLSTGLATVLKLAQPSGYEEWRRHIATLSPQAIAAEYGHDASRHVAALARTS